MAKDLPYFKFFCSEWNDGKITLEDYKTQGVFISVCSYYWSNECQLTSKTLMKKFRNNKEDLELLINEGFILDKKGVISIKFLDEQKEERLKTNKARSRGGKASAKARREKKEKEQVLNSSSTNDEQMLNSVATETHVIRKEEKRKEEIKEEGLNINTEKVNLVLKTFDETNFENTQRVLKTSKEEIRKKLEEFLEVEILTPTFKNKQIGEVLKHFRNWLNYNKPKEVRTKEKATWVGKCN